MLYSVCNVINYRCTYFTYTVFSQKKIRWNYLFIVAWYNHGSYFHNVYIYVQICTRYASKPTLLVFTENYITQVLLRFFTF